jgi:hypothetical protein
MKKKLAILFVLSLLIALRTSQSASDQRIVAIGDIHGAYEAFVNILRKTELIDSGNRWIAKNTTFIQPGDVLDRGADSKKAMDLLMQLEKQAKGKGSQVIPLLGNHEVMNLIGDLRYVSEGEYASYADQNSSSRRDKALQEYENYLQSRAESRKGQTAPYTPELRVAWKQKHPAGYFEHREAFGPNGIYGKWIRTHKAIGEVKGILFLHGGLSPAVSSFSVKTLNAQIQKEIQTFDETKKYFIDRKIILPFFDLDEMLTAAKEELDSLGTKIESDDQKNYQKLLQQFLGIGSWLITHQDGPLWFRGYAEWTDDQGNIEVPKLLETFHARQFVVAHTVQKDAMIHQRFNGKVFLIDTGMLGGSFFPGGRPSALEIRGNDVTAIYLDHRDSLSKPQQ